MTCMQPKTYFLRPDIATQLGIAVVREFFAQKVINSKGGGDELKNWVRQAHLMHLWCNVHVVKCVCC